MKAAATVEGAGAAVGPVLDEIPAAFAGNRWFCETYWPDNRPRVQRILTDVVAAFPPGRDVRLLDVGCGNGFISYGMARLGYSVTATDTWELEHRDALFSGSGVEYFAANFNDPDPLRDLAPASFDVALLGEVIEHILNHPVGLLRSIARALRPGGLLVLTTPNPSTLANAVRTLLDRHTLWGTPEFADTPKIDGGEVISCGDIHYREYRAVELRAMLDRAGFHVVHAGFAGTGASTHQPRWKRLCKRLTLGKWLLTKRLFAASHYILAERRRAPAASGGHDE